MFLPGKAANCFTNLVWQVWIACWLLPTLLSKGSLDVKASALALWRINQSQWRLLAQKKHFMNAGVLSLRCVELHKQCKYTQVEVRTNVLSETDLKQLHTDTALASLHDCCWKYRKAQKHLDVQREWDQVWHYYS